MGATRSVVAALGVVTVLLTAMFMVTVGVAAPARADEPESTEARVLVVQALALIANEAGPDRVTDKVRDALGAPEQAGVDQAELTRALEVLEAPGAGEAAIGQARPLLLDSIGARPATGYGTTAPIGQVAGRPPFPAAPRT